MTPEQIHVRVRRLLWALLSFATTASMSGNITRAVGVHDGAAAVGPIVAAALAPIALLGLTHLFGLWSHIAARGMTYWCFLAAIVALAAAAFRLSFDALRSLTITYGYSHGDAALFPLILDGIVAVCTLGLVALTRIEIATATQAHQPDPAVMQPASLVTHHDANREAAHHGDAPVTQPARTVMQPAPTDAALGPEQPTAGPARVPSARNVWTGGDRAEASPPRMPRLAKAPPSKHTAIAHQLIDAGRTTATPETVRAVLDRAAAGTSSRAIAETLGMSPSSVQRIVKAAREASTPGAA